jgi:HK97 family phage major capsid protein
MPKTKPLAASELRARADGESVLTHANRVRRAIQDQIDALYDITRDAERDGRSEKSFLADEQRDYDAGRRNLKSLDALLDEICESPEGRGIDPNQYIPGAYVGDGFVSDPRAFVDGEPLGKRSMVDFVRAADPHAHVPAGERELDLSKWLRGIAIGDWTDAEPERRAMAEGTLSAGGYMVPTLLAAQLIDLARNKARVLESGATLFPMKNSRIDVPRWAGDPQPAWRAENATIPATDATISKLTLIAKSLAAQTIVSRELLEDVDTLGSVLIDKVSTEIALSIDLAALYGAGSATIPQGIKTAAGVTVTSLGTNGVVPASYDFLVDAVGVLQDANETPNGIIFSPRTQRELSKLKDSTQQPLRPPPILEPLPMRVTNQIPNTLTVGTGTTTSDAFIADWSQLFFGVRTELAITVLHERYADAGQVGFLAWFRGDIGIARPAAFTVVKGIL